MRSPLTESVETWIPFLDLDALHAPCRAELDAVWHEISATGAFIGGPAVTSFEAAWAEYCGTTAAVGVANGTDAVELALRALGIGRGDEVIVPANTFIGTVEAIVAVGAEPVLVDVEPNTLLVGPDQIGAALTSATAAVIPVHLYGQPCDMTAIAALAARAGIAVIEDAAQAHGARWAGAPPGAHSTAAAFSFYPGKNLGAFGDGGAVVTNDEALAARVRSLSNHGRADTQHVRHELIGRNSRLDALQAAVLSIKLPYLDEWNRARRTRRDEYVEALDGTVAEPVTELPEATSVWHLNVVQVPARDAVLALLRERGVDARIHYPQPCHRHPALTHHTPLPVVEAAAERIISLPLGPTMSTADVAKVCDILGSLLAELGHTP